MKYLLDAECMKERDSAQEYLKYRFSFPDYYGKNLDALYDLMSEMNNVEVEIINMKEENAKSYLNRIITVMKEAGVDVIVKR